MLSVQRTSKATPYLRKEVMGNCTLYLGDCMQIIPTLGAVDAVVIDPPYGEKTHKGARSLARDGKFLDFDSISEADLHSAVGTLLTTSKRWLVFTCEWQFAYGLEKQFPDEFIRLGAWLKPNGAPQITGDRPSTGWEAVVIMRPKGRKKWNGGGHPATWVHNIVPPGKNRHPTEKPVSLVADWLRKFTDPGETILDPYMGSGTTLYCCMQMNRKAIGIEIDAKYFDIACRRMESAYAQMPLWV